MHATLTHFLRVQLGLVLTVIATFSLSAAPVGHGAEPHEKASTDAKPTFLESVQCAVCHANSARARAMRDAAGNPLAPYDLWRSTAMANSSRDPYWRAVLSAEVAATPSLREAIEAKCTRCHAPMAGAPPHDTDRKLLAHLAGDDERSWLGLDGVSCTVCHQIQDKNLGTPASFRGQFVIGEQGPIFGPHQAPFTRPMQNHTGFTPTYSTHVLKSALCATCHTLDTEAVRADGIATGHLLHEQSPYLEWRNSVFNDELANPHEDAQNCQGCHMPTHDEQGRPIATSIAHNPGGRDWPFLGARTPFGRHQFLGGNVFLTRVLLKRQEQLEVPATTEALTTRLEVATAFLKQQSGRIAFGRVQRQGARLQIPVVVTNLTGHKLPTAYPSRRVWVRVEVRDQDNQLVFASGRFNKQGVLIGAKTNPLSCELAGGPLLPHFQRIGTSRQVQVYESVMADADGQPTFRLLRGATYLKDNRLLPRGWDSAHDDALATAPAGVKDDPDFAAGKDTVVYIVPAAPGPLQIQASLHYQVISPRHAHELFAHSTPEVATFEKIYQAVSNRPVTIAAVELQVP